MLYKAITNIYTMPFFLTRGCTGEGTLLRPVVVTVFCPWIRL